MGEPVQKKPNQAVSSDPSTVRRNPPKCGKGEYLDTNERGEYICLLDPGPPGILIGDGMTCGEEGGIPCDFGSERFGIPKKLLENLTNLIMGKAEYSCKTKTPATEQWIVQRDVSVTRIPNESEENARARLEQAARDLTKTITGCHNVKFEGLQPIANGQTKSAAPPSKPTTVIANKCEGEWATRPVCRK